MAVNLREEEAYLEGVKEALKAEAERLAEKMHYYSDASGEHIRYCWEEQSAFDGGEERFNQMVLQRLVDSGEQAREQFRRIGKLLDSPYFARIDFREDGELEERLHLLTYDSEEFYDGVMVTAVSMSKGLEFDRVVVPDVDDDNYHSAYDRGLLYVACTRAMHGLVLLYCGKRSRCLDESEDGGSESCGE